jgi:cell division protein FtsB
MDLRIKRPEIRVLPHAQRGIGALVERVPRAKAFGQRVGNRVAHRVGGPVFGSPVFGGPVNEKLRPVFAWLYGARRRLATLAVGVVTVWLFLHVMFGANGMVVYRQKRAEYQNLSREIDQLQKENDRYTAQIKALQTDPQTIEKEAREQLHYARPGEVIYVSPAPLPLQPPATNAAQK